MRKYGIHHTSGKAKLFSHSPRSKYLLCFMFPLHSGLLLLSSTGKCLCNDTQSFLRTSGNCFLVFLQSLTLLSVCGNSFHQNKYVLLYITYFTILSGICTYSIGIISRSSANVLTYCILLLNLELKHKKKGYLSSNLL